MQAVCAARRISINLKDAEMNWDRIEGNWKQLEKQSHERGEGALQQVVSRIQLVTGSCLTRCST
jgi:hypothetical protein